MKRMILKIVGAGVLCASLLSTQPVSADACCNDWCDQLCMCGEWEVGAHALYWVPVTCQWDYVADGDEMTGVPVTQIDVAGLGCGANWGFRLFGNYVCDCTLVGLSYQWFDAQSTRSRSGGILRIIGGDEEPDTKVDATGHIQYQNVDLRVGKYFHRSCGCNLYVFGNARWVDLSYERKVKQTRLTTGAVLQTKEKSALQGGAIGAGVGADVDAWCDFGLFGDANLLGVIGKRRTTNVVFQSFTGEGGPSGRASYTPASCIFPEMDFRIGINYRYTCGCWTVVGEVGYEMDYFWDVTAFPEAVSSITGDSGWNLKCGNIGFSGLFFGGKVLF